MSDTVSDFGPHYFPSFQCIYYATDTLRLNVCVWRENERERESLVFDALVWTRWQLWVMEGQRLDVAAVLYWTKPLGASSQILT